MLTRTLKFVIISRFSKPLLVMFVVLIFYSVFISHTLSNGYGLSGAFQKIYGSAVTSFLLALPAVSGGIAVLKSDRDYLFTLPLRRSEVATSLFIVQFMSFGLILLYFIINVSPALGSEFPFSLIAMVSIALSASALGPITYTFRTGWRLVIAVAIALWSISPVFGFIYAPSAIFTGHAITATLTAVPLAAITVPLAFRSLFTVDLDVMRTMARYSSGQARRTRNFIGLTPLRAVMAENFEVVEVSGRMNSMGGGGSYRSAKFRLVNGMLATTILAAVYFAVVLKSPYSSAFYETLFPAVYSSFIVLFMSMGVLGNERIWLSFLAMNPQRYLKYMMASKAFSFSALLSPIAAVNFILAIKGYPGTLGFGLSLLAILPSLLVFVVFISAFTSPIQIREDIMMPAQFNLRQMAMFFPMLVGIGLISGSVLSAPFGVIASVSMVFVAFLMLNSRKMATNVVQKLVECGFV